MIRILFLFLTLLSTEVFSQVTIFPDSYSLEKYSGEWDQETASHLLRRALFGPTYNQITTAANQNIDLAVDNLFKNKPAFIDEPRAYDPKEAVVQFGESWINSVYPNNNNADTQSARVRSLNAWLMQELLQPSQTIHERMFMFWVNHFGTANNSNDARITYSFFKLLKESSLGDFKKLIKEVTIHPHMLSFLNGKDNKGSKPNDNYARELLELYTIGKAEQVSPVDYGNYTEQDVLAGSRIFSGYVIEGVKSTTITMPFSKFVSKRHSTDEKKLSAYFNNIEVPTTGEQEYAEYIDIIFNQDNIGVFISEELYRFFVGYVTDDVRQFILPQMNELLKASNFNIETVIKTLLKSEHFYDKALRGSIIKSPLDFLLSIYTSTESVPNFTFEVNYKLGNKINRFLRNNDMDIYNIPSVAGWEAYYLSPSYSKIWINSTYLINRVSFADRYVSGKGFKEGNNFFHPNVLGMIEKFSVPLNPTKLIDDLCLVLFSQEISNTDKLELKNILTDNLPDFEWTVEYNKYLQDTSNEDQKKVVSDRLRKVLSKAIKLYNFQIF